MTRSATEWEELSPALRAQRERPTQQQIELQQKREAARQEQIEAARRARRDAAREAASRAVLAERKLAEIDGTIAEVNRRLDAHAEWHSAEAAPLQSRLAEIERQLIASISARTETSPKLETERTKLLTDVRKLNSELEDKVASENRLLDGLKAERHEAAVGTGCGVTAKGELIQSACLATRVAYILAGRRVARAQAWLQAIAERHPADPFYRALAAAESQVAMQELIAAQRDEQAAIEAAINEN